MKRILDRSFQYKPSFNTDVRKTFERIRRQQQPKPEEPEKNRVRYLERKGKANGG
jgi:hypothetical protein